MYCIFLLCSWGLCRFPFLVHIKRESIWGGRVSRSNSDVALHFGYQISPALLKGRWRWELVGHVCKLNWPTEKKCIIDRVDAKLSGAQRRIEWSHSVIHSHTWIKAGEHIRLCYLVLNITLRCRKGDSLVSLTVPTGCFLKVITQSNACQYCTYG